MAAELSNVIAVYFDAKNRHDIDAMLAGFARDAVVLDERRERRGRSAIREWMEETTRKYRATVEITGVAATDSGAVVTALVSGNFPGSPVTLRYHFTLADEAISRLEVTQ